MPDEPQAQSGPKIIVDEDWKSRVEAEREQLRAQEAKPTTPPTPESPPEKSAATAPRAAGKQSAAQLPPASLSMLVETLAMQAMASLGHAAAPPNAESGGAQEDQADPQFHLAMAQHLIDTLDILQQKTRGNLTGDESQHLDHVLHDLRLAFVQVRGHVSSRA